ncbi:MAG: hypothetical protein HY393_01165 [Candidatus Diapherotrites archaeon]|nr:hypothetical protein [Candidatus Diapherotrites archaeon]
MTTSFTQRKTSKAIALIFLGLAGLLAGTFNASATHGSCSATIPQTITQSIKICDGNYTVSDVNITGNNVTVACSPGTVLKGIPSAPWPQSSGFRVLADNVTIQGCHMEGFYSAIEAFTGGWKNLTIKENAFFGFDQFPINGVVVINESALVSNNYFKNVSAPWFESTHLQLVENTFEGMPNTINVYMPSPLFTSEIRGNILNAQGSLYPLELTGLQISGAGNALVKENHFEGFYNGLWVVGSMHATIAKNRFKDNGTGVSVLFASPIPLADQSREITENFFQSSKTRDIAITGEIYEHFPSVFISKNTEQDVKGTGIELLVYTTPIIADNIIQLAPEGKYGIRSQLKQHNGVISNNRIQMNANSSGTGMGISVEKTLFAPPTGTMNIKENLIQGTGQGTGIAVKQAKDVQVSQNIVKGFDAPAGGTGISLNDIIGVLVSWNRLQSNFINLYIGNAFDVSVSANDFYIGSPTQAQDSGTNTKWATFDQSTGKVFGNWFSDYFRPVQGCIDTTPLPLGDGFCDTGYYVQPSNVEALAAVHAYNS